MDKDELKFRLEKVLVDLWFSGYNTHKAKVVKGNIIPTDKEKEDVRKAFLQIADFFAPTKAIKGEKVKDE